MRIGRETIRPAEGGLHTSHWISAINGECERLTLGAASCVTHPHIGDQSMGSNNERIHETGLGLR